VSKAAKKFRQRKKHLRRKAKARGWILLESPLTAGNFHWLPPHLRETVSPGETWGPAWALVLHELPGWAWGSSPLFGSPWEVQRALESRRAMAERAGADPAYARALVAVYAMAPSRRALREMLDGYVEPDWAEGDARVPNRGAVLARIRAASPPP
jgi:hypothetical protein